MSGSTRRQFLVLAFFLALFTFALYTPVVVHPFVNFDDDVYITANDHVRAGLTWQTVGWAFTNYDAANWHPLTWLSHAADYQYFGAKPAGHHDVNLLLHAINVVLLFWLLLRATGYIGRCSMVAALFALHPINTETVVWVSERKNLLSMTFFLLALGAYGWYAAAPAGSRARRLRYLAVGFLYALALMAKPQVVTFPFVLLLCDYWPLGLFAPHRTPSKDSYGEERFTFLLLEKLPFLIMSLASAWITVQAQRQGGGFNPDYTLFVRCENALVSYVRYIGKAFWPARLAVLYPHPGTSLRLWQAGTALLVLAGITALAVAARRQRYLLFGWLWFLGTLVPMIGIIQVGRQAMADRYAYLSFIGLFIMICWGIADLAERRGIPNPWIAAPACLVLIALSAVTHRQIGYWSDNVTLWTHTALVTSANYQAEDNLGQALEKAGRLGEAIPHYVRAAQINPAFPPATMYLAVEDQREGNLRDAIAKYQKVIRETDNAVHQNAAMRGMAFGNMGRAYRELGAFPAARANLQKAVQLNNKNFQAWVDLGVVSQILGAPADAAYAYQQALRFQPSDVGYVLLARALQQAGQKEQADAALQKAKLLTNDYERAQQSADLLLRPR